VTRKRKERKYLKREGLIRFAGKEDCTFIRALSDEVFSEFGDYSEIIPAWFENPDVVTLTYIKNGHPVGFAMLYVLSGEILAIAVLPTYQRRGIGTTLLSHIERLASQLGLRKLVLHTAEVNQVARGFFRRACFRIIEVQKDYYPHGQQALVFSKNI
jgi:ribosomal-protein-alanine N-acetyltransferase